MRKSGTMVLCMAAAMAASCGGTRDTEPFEPAPPAHVEWLSPLPAGVQLNAVRLADAGVGIAVGELGMVVVTNDGGLTWSMTTSGTQSSLKGVAFAQAANAVAVGERGTLLRTENGGRAWTAIPSKTPHELRAAAFGTPDIGVIVGTDGTILRTSDGGRQWQAVASGVSVTLRAAAFATPSVVVAVGDSGTLLRSTDGGLSWGPCPSGTSAALRGIQFADAITGVAVGGDDSLWRAARVIVRTTDGGATWTKVKSPGGGRLYGVTCAGPGQIIAVGENGATLHTSDAGQNWQAVAADKTTWLACVSATGSRIIAVGAGGKIFHSSDLGAKWTYLQQKQPAISISAIARPDKDTILIAGGPSILRSEGRTDFVKTKTAKAKSINAMSFLNSLVGIAVGAEGVIQRTVDGGKTWTAVESGTKRNLSVVAFSDEKNGIAVGNFGGDAPSIIRTEDAGQTWHEQICGNRAAICDDSAYISAMALLSGGFGLAVGRSGYVFRTTDGGRTWVQLAQNLTAALLYGVALLDSYHAVAVGWDGMILRTEDGGATWTRRRSGTLMHLNSVAFADRLNGLAVGAYGTVLATSDGGLTWQSEPLRTRGFFRTVMFDSSGVAFMAGNSGLLMRHTWDAPSQEPANKAAQGMHHE